MNTQVSQSASRLAEWLQTAGVAYGMRIVAALVILLAGAIAIRNQHAQFGTRKPFHLYPHLT